MGLFGLFRPKWQSKNPEVRLAAVAALDAGELETLVALAGEDEDPRVQQAALARIEDRGALESLAGRALAAEVAAAVAARLQPLHCAALLEGAPGEDATALLARVTDPALLARLAVAAPTPALRVAAVQRIDDPETLCAVVEQNCGKEPGRAALAKITEPQWLERFAEGAASKVTRRLAEEKLAALTAPAPAEPAPATPAKAAEPRPPRPEPDPQPDPEAEAQRELEERRAKQEELVAALEGLTGDAEVDAARLDTLQQGWADAHGDAAPEELAARYRGACAQIEEAQASRAEEERTLAGWEEQFAAARARLEAGEGEAAEPVLATLAEQLSAAEGRLAKGTDLPERVQQARRAAAEQRAERAAARQAAAREQREALCAEFEALAGAEDRTAAGRRAKQLGTEWKKLPALEDRKASRALEERFRAARDGFKVSQAPHLEQQEWQRWANRTQQEALCAEAEALDAEEDLATVAERVKDAHRRWKEIGPAPRADAEALWQRFKTACDRNFERCKPHFDELARQRAAALELREELCRQAEEHAESSAWKESAEALKALQAQWKEAGSVPRRKDQALYARFRTACDRFFARRQEHFAELDEQRRGNQAAKEKLCARAEALADAPDRDHIKAFRDLQAEWKAAGPAPRDAEAGLWARFRGACDRFFAWLDEGRLETLRVKEALCEEAEALVAAAPEGDDPRAVAGQIARLQKRWEEAGPAPRDREEAVWRRFRAACDGFFEARREQFERLEEERRATEEQKLALLERAEELVDGGEGPEVAEALKELQHSWNELGPATREREGELRQRFGELCDGFFAGRREQRAEQDAARRDNLKAKEALCVELERAVGAAAEDGGAAANSALSLAEQLQVALASNFALAGDQDTPERRLEEVRRIQLRWREIGPVPREHDRALWARYRGLLDGFYAERRGEREVEGLGEP